MCVQYAQVGHPVNMEKALHRHRVLASVVLGWIAALTVLLVALHFKLTWWISLIGVIVLLVVISVVAYFFLVPYLLKR